MAQTAIDCFHSIAGVWGGPVGVVLIEAYYTGDGYTTVAKVAERMMVSEDTARRELDRLVETRLVTEVRRGRTRCYRAMDRPAEDSARAMGAVWLQLATDLLTLDA